MSSGVPRTRPGSRRGGHHDRPTGRGGLQSLLLVQVERVVAERPVCPEEAGVHATGLDQFAQRVATRKVAGKRDVRPSDHHLGLREMRLELRAEMRIMEAIRRLEEPPVLLDQVSHARDRGSAGLLLRQSESVDTGGGDRAHGLVLGKRRRGKSPRGLSARRAFALAPVPRTDDNNRMSDFLFAWPSFARGMATVLDLAGEFEMYNDSPGTDIADARAFLSDWRALGHDLIASAQQGAQG